MSRKNPYETPSYNQPFEPGPRDPFAVAAPSRAARQGNPGGVTGFVLSLVGLTCCGPLSLVSLIVSLVAMRQEPKGLAIAGVAISLVSLVMNLVFAVIGYFTLSMMGHGSASAGLELIFEYAMIDVEIQENGSLPAALGELNLTTKQTTDPWGNPYEYSVFPDGGDYKLISLGPDGTLGTSDDVQLNPQ